MRAALIRFADLCSMMRPQKCRLKISWSSINFFGVFFNFYGDILSTLRPYVKNLLPCLIRICRRPEESIQETLASVMPKLCFVFMRFATDAEIKVRRSSNSVHFTFSVVDNYFVADVNSSISAKPEVEFGRCASHCSEFDRVDCFSLSQTQSLLPIHPLKCCWCVQTHTHCTVYCHLAQKLLGLFRFL